MWENYLRSKSFSPSQAIRWCSLADILIVTSWDPKPEALSSAAPKFLMCTKLCEINVYYCFEMLLLRVICFTKIGNYHKVDDMEIGHPGFELIWVWLGLCLSLVNCEAHFPFCSKLILQFLLATNATCILNKLYLDTNRHNRKYIHRYILFFYIG